MYDIGFTTWQRGCQLVIPVISTYIVIPSEELYACYAKGYIVIQMSDI